MLFRAVLVDPELPHTSTAKGTHEKRQCLKLYEFPPTRSIRARWMLQELGIEFEAITVNLQHGDHLKPEYRKINPATKLPALVDGDFVLTESVAIVLYLAGGAQ